MTSGATSTAVRRQIAAMGCELFEVGVFRPETAGTDASMLLRVWDQDTLLHSVPWLQLQNRAGRHIYIRPKGEHNLSLERRYQIETKRTWALEQITWAHREHLPAEERQMKRVVQDCELLLEEMTLIERARADRRQKVRIRQERGRARK